MKAIVYPLHYIKDGIQMVDLGDGQNITLAHYRFCKKLNAKKCVRCNHRQDSHYGQCRYTKDTMMCTCQGFKEE